MTKEQESTDWKSIAIALAQRVNFAVTNLDGAGMLLNTNTMKTQFWRDYMVEALELMPGVEVDREILATLSLSKSKRKKAQAEIIDRRNSVRAAAEIGKAMK